jgi:hypothetical protein
MKRPDNINDALNHLHMLTMAIANGTANLMESSTIRSGHLEPIKDAALDAHLLVTWIKDNIKELHK